MTAVAGNVRFRDGLGGSVIFVLPHVSLATVIPFNLTGGRLSGAANQALTVQGAALAVLNGTIWGIEQ